MLDNKKIKLFKMTMQWKMKTICMFGGVENTGSSQLNNLLFVNKFKKMIFFLIIKKKRKEKKVEVGNTVSL